MKTWLRGKFTALIVYLAISTLVIGGLGWVTAAVLRLEENQQRSDFDKELNVQINLALWRLDSRVAPALAREDSRPFNFYSACYAPAHLFSNDGQAAEQGRYLEPTPLLCSDLPEWMLLHFQADAITGWSSPQVLSERSLETALCRAKVPQDNVTEERSRLLHGLAGCGATPQALIDSVAQRCTVLPTTESTLVPTGTLQVQQSKEPAAEQIQGPVYGQELNPGNPNNFKDIAQAVRQQSSGQQSYLKNNDYDSRVQQRDKVNKEVQMQKAQTADLSWAMGNSIRNGASWLVPNSFKTMRSQKAEVRMGPMVPLWLTPADERERLVVARLVEIGDKQICQGVLLDWSRLQQMLADEVSDLFPEATFTAVYAAEPPDRARTMNWLPVQLNPGPVEPPAMETWTPLRAGLASAWVAALVALAAVGLGGWSLIALSDRRIRFVSAVTHELRTPLTTLRLYLDMLNGGMVQEEEQKAEYLQTLHSETERLNRLVANVLDFSRLERQRPRLERTCVPVAEVLEQVHASWEGHCKNTGKELVIDNTLDEGATVTTDVKLAQQVLGNLVDNACKYSRDAADSRIWLRARAEGRQTILEVEDCGPGVPLRERRSIFRAFRRGHGADVKAGGVGLGLALAQQWAALLGGRLSVSAGRAGCGACFRLEL